MNNKFFAVTMASIMSLNVFTTNVFMKTVQAETTFKSNVNKIEKPVTGGSNDEWSGSYIYFGRYPQTLKSGKASNSKDPNDFEIEPIKWRVLDPRNRMWRGTSPTDNSFAYELGYVTSDTDTNKGGRQNAPVGGNGILLYSDKSIDAKPYHPTYEGNNEVNTLCYGGNGGGSGKGSTIWAWLNGRDNTNVLEKSSGVSSDVPTPSFIETAFTEAEQNAIMPTKVYSEDLYSDRTGATDTSHKRASSPRTSLTEDKVFLPSYNEMLNDSYGFKDTRINSKTRSFNFSNYSNNLKESGYSSSWLRSPGLTYDALAAGLSSAGYVSYGYYVYRSVGVCPALNLNPTSVILASEADEVGSSIAEGDGKKILEVSSTPAKFELPTEVGSEYKLTLQDGSRDSFTASKTAQNGNEITISYSNAKTGANEYISCMILDSKSEIKYYGKLANSTTGSGTVTLKLPSDIDSGQHSIFVINEQCNGSYETDWSSKPINCSEITLQTQAAPSAPKMQRKTISSIMLEPIEANANGAKVEYKMNDEDWQDSNVFKDLQDGTEYTFYARYVATADGNFGTSQPSNSTKITTLKQNISNSGGGSTNNGNDNTNSNGEDDEYIEAKRDEIIISDKIQQIKNGNGVANIETKRSGDEIEVNITDENGNAVEITEGITLVVSYNTFKPGTVAAVINKDGAIVIRKSVAKDGKLYVPLKSSSTFKIIDNAKTFSDVSNHWASDAVNFVSAHELFIGTAPNIFEPETTMSRAMLAQVLYNLEGNPNQNVEEIFDDVKSSDWFAKAVTWAVKNNFMTGYNTKNFAPNDAITREQLATILYRYFGNNEIVDIELNFTNANQISDYALKAMKWAVKYGIIQGNGNNILNSNSSATRAQVAQMFQNLMLKLFY